jgi:hypothetical protein
MLKAPWKNCAKPAGELVKNTGLVPCPDSQNFWLGINLGFFARLLINQSPAVSTAQDPLLPPSFWQLSTLSTGPIITSAKYINNLGVVS